MKLNFWRKPIARSVDENDTIAKNKGYSYLCHAGVTKGIKKRMNRRFRRQGKKIIEKLINDSY